jgi:hypothetical protein
MFYFDIIINIFYSFIYLRIVIALSEKSFASVASNAHLYHMALVKLNNLRFGISVPKTKFYYNYPWILNVVSLFGSVFLFLLGMTLTGRSA